LVVGWDDTTKTVTGTGTGIVIKLQIDQVKATVNGKEFLLDVPATVINGRTLVPARFVAEATGATVGWNGATRTISIDQKLTNNGLAIHDEFDNVNPDAVNAIINDNMSINPVSASSSVSIISVGLVTEQVVIMNSSTESVQMKGYKLVSVRGNQVYTFPDYLLGAGQSVTVYSGKGSGDLKWTGSYMWNNDGDPAELYDPSGNLISNF
jgi:hypothetical protein